MQDQNPSTSTRDSIRTGFIEILNSNQNESLKDINEETIVADKFPDMDDLDRVEIIMETESAFNINIEDEEVSDPDENIQNYVYVFKFKTIKEWVDFIEQKQINGKPNPASE